MPSTRMKFAALALALPLTLAACGTDSESTDAAAPATTSAAPSTSPSETTSAGMDSPFGAACSAVPADGAGSFDGMSKEPVATAASNNPLLSTLVTAVTEAGLGDTLNSADGITVFAPTNDAFDALPKETLDAAWPTRRACSPTSSPTTSSPVASLPTRWPATTRPSAAARSPSRAPARSSP